MGKIIFDKVIVEGASIGEYGVVDAITPSRKLLAAPLLCQQFGYTFKPLIPALLTIPTTNFVQHMIMYQDGYIWLNENTTDVFRLSIDTNVMTKFPVASVSNINYRRSLVPFDGQYYWFVTPQYDGDFLGKTKQQLPNATFGVVNKRFSNTLGNPYFDGNNLWITDFNALYKIDVNSSEIVIINSIYNPYFYIDCPLISDGKFLWVGGSNSNGLIIKIDPNLCIVIATITIPIGYHDLAFDGKYLWVLNGASLTKIDPVTNTVLIMTMTLDLDYWTLCYAEEYLYLVYATTVRKIPV